MNGHHPRLARGYRTRLTGHLAPLGLGGARRSGFGARRRGEITPSLRSGPALSSRHETLGPRRRPRCDPRRRRRGRPAQGARARDQVLRPLPRGRRSQPPGGGSAARPRSSSWPTGGPTSSSASRPSTSAARTRSPCASRECRPGPTCRPTPPCSPSRPRTSRTSWPSPRRSKGIRGALPSEDAGRIAAAPGDKVPDTRNKGKMVMR